MDAVRDLRSITDTFVPAAIINLATKPFLVEDLGRRGKPRFQLDQDLQFGRCKQDVDVYFGSGSLLSIL